jgi:hypothetical protein
VGKHSLGKWLERPLGLINNEKREVRKEKREEKLKNLHKTPA